MATVRSPSLTFPINSFKLEIELIIEREIPELISEIAIKTKSEIAIGKRTYMFFYPKWLLDGFLWVNYDHLMKSALTTVR